MRRVTRRTIAVLVLGMAASSIALDSPAQASDCYGPLIYFGLDYCYQN